MKQRPQILAILEVDDTAELLVERATFIAKTFDCDVHLVLFDPDRGPLLGGAIPFSSHEAIAAQQVIDNIQAEFVNENADKIRTAGVAVTTSILNTRPLGEHILNLAKDFNTRLIVKTTRYHSSAERSALLDSDWQLLRTCPYPLWLVKPGSFPNTPTIAAAVDPLHEHDKPATLDHEIIDTARLIANKMDGNVRLFHAYQTLAGIGTAALKATTPSVIAIDEVNERTRSAHEKALADLAAAHEIADSDITIQPGRAHELLPTFVRDKHVSLLILGGISRWGLKRMIVGSTAERVMDHIPCDILVTRIGMHPIIEPQA